MTLHRIALHSIYIYTHGSKAGVCQALALTIPRYPCLKLCGCSACFSRVLGIEMQDAIYIAHKAPSISNHNNDVLHKLEDYFHC